MGTTRLAIACVFTLVGASALAVPASARPPSQPDGRDSLEVYVGTLNPKQFEELRTVGVDIGDTATSRDTSGDANPEYHERRFRVRNAW
jgi:hypothetical protein